ncbi:ABC transporter permease [Acrocarpospora macrocephala]|uniref:ABC transporter permease n=1 Tax=Acrocarpospora macrocephala TaxID=150177 RepID=A0A5M3WJJ8_9ACTN|nr:ABC transporter permease [Acrocarpospora macrocephala]GES09114.1 ABC transporter permease [Acrocarpospora macrocephala]
MKRLDGIARSGLVFLLALVVLVVVAQVTGLGGDPEKIVGPRLAPPGPEWWLGTDSLGRSTLPRVLQGTGTSLLLSAVAVLATAVVATALGVLAGYQGGALNEIVMRVVDVLYSFPAIILAILVAALVNPGLDAAVASIVLVTIPLMTRVVRAAALTVSHRDYVTSAIISGARLPRVLGRHILPNVAGTVAVQGTYALSIGILVEGGLSFLGLGVQPPQASLGVLISEGTVYLTYAPWLLLGPGVVLVLAILSINVLGDGLRDQLDPRTSRSLT